MLTQDKQAQPIFPDLPRESPVVNKEGNFTETWSLAVSQLFQNLQQNFKNEGILFPPLTAAQISTIQAIYTPYIGQPLPQNTQQKNIPDISGQTVFDTTNRVPKIFVITYDTSTPPKILTASWKTFTLI